ncbi:MAG: tetratricopeptide repeat protein [Candidatus Cloacimonetes bacterium]|nr:tetratricopeptide repeat protein [Candidatus Cloacimonadota bacterium]
MALFFLVTVLGIVGYVGYSIIATNPAQVHFKKALEFLEAGNLYEAEQFFIKTVEADPLHVRSMNELANIYESQGVLDKCVAELKRLIGSSANPFDKLCTSSYWRMAEIYYAQEKYQDAWQIFILLLKMGIISSKLYFYLGELYMIQKRFAEAIVFFDESLALNKDQIQTVFYKALCLISIKEPREALKSLKVTELDKEFKSQSLFLLGMINLELEKTKEASFFFGALLSERNPIFLKDILFYKSYEILLKEEVTDEELNKVVAYLNRGIQLKNIFSDVKKEFLFHLGGVYLLKKQFNEAKMVYRDLCRIDAYYKGADQILKSVAKELLIKEEHAGIIEQYTKFQRTGHYKHALTQSLNIEEFFPTNLPILVIEKLEENAQKKFLEMIKNQDNSTKKLSMVVPKTPLELSNSKYEVFLNTCQSLCEKLAVVVDKNLAERKTEAMFLGIDKESLQNLVFFYKPAAMVGAIALLDFLDLKDKYNAKKMIYISCGGFTEEAVEVSKKHGIVLYDRHQLKKLI